MLKAKAEALEADGSAVHKLENVTGLDLDRDGTVGAPPPPGDAKQASEAAKA